MAADVPQRPRVDRVSAPQPRLVVFDCDGVLVDSERLAVEIDVRAIAELGWPITRDEVIERHLGRSEADALADIESVIGRPVPADWIQRWGEVYGTVFDTELEAVPGVAQALARLVAEGWLVCVATSGRRERTWRKLRRCGLDGWFTDEQIFTAADVSVGKPAPDLFLLAAAQMGVPPARCVVVEDSHHGVAAALAAGMPCVGFVGAVSRPGQVDGAAVTLVDELSGLPAVADRLVPDDPRPVT